MYAAGAFYTDGNRSVIRGGSPTLYFRDTDQRSGMIHINSNRTYFLSGGTDSESWATTKHNRWPMYLQNDTNLTQLGGGIIIYSHDSSVPTYSSATWANQIYLDGFYRRWSIGVEASGSYALGFFRWSSSTGGTRYLNGYIHGTKYSRDMSNFTGQHRTFIKDIPYTFAATHEGLIVSDNNDTYIKMSDGIAYGSNAITINESLPVVSISRKKYDKACFGVISTSEDPETRSDSFGKFVSVYEKELGDTRVYINSVGEGGVWVTNINGPLESGDYITTSSIPGYGMKQHTETLSNYTVAKITMNCDFNPRLQPIKRIIKELKNKKYWVKREYPTITKEEYDTLEESKRTRVEKSEESMSYRRIDTVEVEKDPLDDEYELQIREELVNVLDEHGQLQWEDTGEMERCYKIRYLLPDGTQISEEEYTTKALANEEVYIAAFVGCTYHCG